MPVGYNMQVDDDDTRVGNKRPALGNTDIHRSEKIRGVELPPEQSPEPLSRTASADSAAQTLSLFTPQGTPGPGDELGPGNETEMRVEVQPPHPEYAALPDSKKLSELILDKIRDTYVERKLNNYEVIINIHFKTINDNIESIESILSQLQPSRGGKYNKFRNNEKGYTRNRFRKKNQNGGLCDTRTMIDFGDYIKPAEIVFLNGTNTVLNNANITTNSAVDKHTLLNILLKLLFMADNNKDFNLRTEIYDLIHCLKAAFNFKDIHKIDLDKDTLYKEVIDVIEHNASYGSMTILSDKLIEMVKNAEQFQLSSGSCLLMDGTPNIVGSTIDKTQRVITLADVFDSAGTQGINDINYPISVQEQITLMNEGLNILKNRYNIISEYISEIKVTNVNDKGFSIQFTLLDTSKSFEIKDIKTGSTGVLTVDAISNQIKGTNNFKLLEIRKGLENAGNVGSDIDKLFNIILIFFKEAGDFIKIWFGFKLGGDNEPNFLTTQDIMFFVVTMFLNFYHTDLQELGINKQTYVILGTGKTQTDGKKIAFVNDDAYFLEETIEYLVRTKISSIYSCNFGVVDGFLKISLFLKDEDGYTLVKHDEQHDEQHDETYIQLIIFNQEINSEIIDADMLRESKIKFAEIMKEVENVISLVNNIGYNDKIKTFKAIIKNKCNQINGVIPRLQPYFTDPVQPNKLPNLIKCSNNILEGLNELLKHVVTYFNPEDLTETLFKLKTLNKDDKQLNDGFLSHMDQNIGVIVEALIKIITDEDTQSSLVTVINSLNAFLKPKIEEYEGIDATPDSKEKKLAEKYRETYSKLNEPIEKSEVLKGSIRGILDKYNAKIETAHSSGGHKSYKKKYNTLPILIHKQKVVKCIKSNKIIKDVKDGKVSKDKTVKSNKIIKDVKDSKVSKDKTVKSNKIIKDVKDRKVSKDKTVKSNKIIKDVKDSKVSKDKNVKDVKDSKVSKDKNVKDVKDGKASKDKTVKSNNIIKDIKDGKEVKDKAEKKLKIGKEKITKNILGKDRRIYKITGDRKEYVKYKNELITVKEYIKGVKSNIKSRNNKMRRTDKK
jgi:hypothetical protein